MRMIADWILHPFRHLEGGHVMMAHHAPGGATASPTVRRVIFVRVQDAGPAPSSLFAIDAVRVALFYVDVDMHTLALLAVRDLGPGTGWGRTPRGAADGGCIPLRLPSVLTSQTGEPTSRRGPHPVPQRGWNRPPFAD